MKKSLTITIIAATILLSLTATLNQTVNAEKTDLSVLTITGLVDQPTDLTLAQLQALPKTNEYATIICVDFPDKILEEGNWTGVKLSVLFETAGIKSGAIKIAIYASDGFSSDLPVEAAMQDNIILAYEKDGQALSSLRLVVPGRWGYKWVNLVARIEAIDYDYMGFWESKGYSDTAIVGQDSGAPKAPQSTPSFTLTPKTPIPSKSPTPTPIQNVTTGGQTTQSPTNQNPAQTNAFPKEAVYVLAVGLIAAIPTATLVLRKKVKK